MKAKQTATLELVRKCCQALDAKKAGDLRVLDVHEQSSITDFMVVTTATSEPHLRALRIEVEKVLDAEKAHIVGMDAIQNSGWMVIDAFDLMIHLFLAEHRENYGLETLWKDAKEISVPTLLAPPKKPAPKKEVAAKKVAVAKKPAPKEEPTAKKKTVVKKKTTAPKKKSIPRAVKSAKE